VKIKEYKEAIIESMQRLSQLEERIKRVKTTGIPSVLREGGVKEEVKYLKGLVESNKAMLKILRYQIEVMERS